MVKSAPKTNLIPRFSLLLGENPGNKVAPKSCMVTKHGQAKDAAEVPAMQSPVLPVILLRAMRT